MIIQSVVALSVAGVASRAAFHRNSTIFGDVLGRLPTAERYVALTFDDGPNPQSTPRILDILAGCGAPATFFLLGRHVEQWPELTQQIVAEGHAIGNHGYFHRQLQFRTRSYIRRDIGLGTRAIRQATGRRPRFFRAPHGFRNPWVARIASSFGQRTVGWTVSCRDTDMPGVGTIEDRTIRRTIPGSIILLHDGDASDARGDRMQTVAALPGILRGLIDRGFRFVQLPHD